MKHISRSVIGIIIASLLLTGCLTDSSKAKSSVKLMYTVYHEGDAQAVEGLVKTYTDSLSINPVPDAYADALSALFPGIDLTISVSNKLVAAMVQKTMEEIKWSVTSTRSVSDHEMIVSSTVTNLDIKSLAGKYALKVAEFTISSLFSGYTEDERTQKCIEILDNLVNENKESRISKNVDVTVKKNNGQWQVQMSDEIIDAMTGGLLSLYSNANYVLSILSTLSNYIK